ncbi:Metallo-hydrolase/oxidoreductase [Epithele typhae]|uniref:Metallo-hydrolase/oxidoreductase n=1 Tax=Epithele typhae TaxID=378194 RepID=UPI002007A55E|nr:Metallo-hydrolase/oxidoreductase [Epithele typhae]KAH9940444.1 Metallo-hydrolase/oxidoreductase [Epithele typhae]
MSLPPPAPNQVFCDVSALEGGHVDAPYSMLVEGGAPDDIRHCPVLVFLIRQTNRADNILFDLGVPKNWDRFPSAVALKDILHLDHHVFGTDLLPVDGLTKGGLSPADITHTFVSHLHLDHIGDPALYPNAELLLGAGGRTALAAGFPGDPAATLPTDYADGKAGRTTWLDPAGWPALGPFAHALDFYGDGSLYVVDAGDGHIAGHLNVLARTSADGGWVYLAGDSAHDWSIIRGERGFGHHHVLGCYHADEGKAMAHVEGIRTLMRENARVRVLIAHDVPWYEENKGGPAFFPGKLESL